MYAYRALATSDDGGDGARVGGLVVGVGAVRPPSVHREVRPLCAVARQDR